MRNEPNQQWDDDLEREQLERLAAHENRPANPLGSGLVPPPPEQPRAGDLRRADDDGATPHESNAQWENDLEADQLESLTAQEATEDEQ